MSNEKLRETFNTIFGAEMGGSEPAETARMPAAEAAPDVTTDAGDDTRPPRRARAHALSDIRRYVAEPEGGFFYPNFLSDYLMRELSLGEQAVFNRLLRMTQTFDEGVGRMRLDDVADACGITPEFAARAIESLQEKGVLRMLKRNPFSKSTSFRLDVTTRWRGKIVLCAVCHAPIRDDDGYVAIPVARSRSGQQHVPAHRECLHGEPIE